jgi:peptidoglycan/xylan/chitin deacetylase (PgdA/CDA1 family)
MIDATSTPRSFPESGPPSLAVRLKRAVAPLAGAVKSLAATRVGWRASGLLRPRGVIVLMYHRISTTGDRFPGLDVEIFREHVEWLARNCSPIGPDDLRAAVTARPTGRPFVLITFDDGYLSYRQHAYPILRKHGVPALVFLATGYIDEPTRLFWWDKLRLAVEESPRGAIELPWTERRSVSLDGPVSRARLLARAKEHLKNQEEDARERDLAELLARLDFPLDAPSHGKQMMDWDDVRAVQDLTRLGGHTHDHPIMSSVAEARVESEVARCRERIRAETGLEPPWFAYPNGRRRDFDEHSRAALLRHGFDCAFSTEEGLVGPDPDWLALRRLPGDKPLRDLAWRIASCPRD